MKKKLLSIFGPLVLAGLLLAALFFSPFKIDADNPSLWAKAASSMSGNVLRGNSIKNNAIRSGKYVPFFGSSELSRISPFHPSVLAQKYQRNYTPFLLGAPGTQSLTQYMMMQSLGSDLTNKKIVFVISPQWFVKGGVTRAYFDAYFSELQTYIWASEIQQVTGEDRYLAKRLLAYDKVTHDTGLESMLRLIAEGTPPSSQQKELAQLHINLLNREDELFSEVGLTSKQQSINKAVAQLPKNYDPVTLDALASRIGASMTKNNSFGISDQFYDKRLKHQLEKLNDSQRQLDYRYSAEFSDFQLVLNQLADVNADALFIIPPVNEKWSDFTGLSQKMLQEFAQKIKFQLNEQGFHNIADFTDRAAEPYFMEDTIHLGWRGWLAADQAIAPFLADGKTKKTTYHLQDYFYSKEWQQLSPEQLTAKKR
ncbi:D-alanyl-lipoteichoic acid biosynthesis protein DltD [Candidatus Enterococcus leclercqii]|uniref:D-alanyl-lipoteichoic acid biosynthesis protein DltD n=1 Tax=Candidatus Enterococcus leclercqii TaxID=1857218 RepID=UPI001379FB8D|nr:D-alanyl-lipoteichoic acid biosynthesis protein DltD [Enterococcus sp. CU9D]KAF1291800.1 D-alanyl-lipoteichoic acid biosynthesis protein DltD [Enterococcus sp. CU9D]